MQHNPFYAGFCTNVNDMYAFDRCGFPEGRIFLVNDRGEVFRKYSFILFFHNDVLFSFIYLQIQSMNRITRRTYDEMHEFLHEIFPAYYGFDAYNYQSLIF